MTKSKKNKRKPQKPRGLADPRGGVIIPPRGFGLQQPNIKLLKKKTPTKKKAQLVFPRIVLKKWGG
ncbi:hypothetical protein ACVGWG_08680, partial [Enterobacter asburiae]